MKPQTALLLRLIGPLIEIGCVLLLRRVSDQGLRVAGVPVESLLYAGMAFGLVLVVAGLTLARSPRNLDPKEWP